MVPPLLFFSVCWAPSARVCLQIIREQIRKEGGRKALRRQTGSLSSGAECQRRQQGRQSCHGAQHLQGGGRQGGAHPGHWEGRGDGLFWIRRPWESGLLGRGSGCQILPGRPQLSGWVSPSVQTGPETSTHRKGGGAKVPKSPSSQQASRAPRHSSPELAGPQPQPSSPTGCTQALSPVEWG